MGGAAELGPRRPWAYCPKDILQLRLATPELPADAWQRAHGGRYELEDDETLAPPADTYLAYLRGLVPDLSHSDLVRALTTQLVPVSVFLGPTPHAIIACMPPVRFAAPALDLRTCLRTVFAAEMDGNKLEETPLIRAVLAALGFNMNSPTIANDLAPYFEYVVSTITKFWGAHRMAEEMFAIWDRLTTHPYLTQSLVDEPCLQSMFLMDLTPHRYIRVTELPDRVVANVKSAVDERAFVWVPPGGVFSYMAWFAPFLAQRAALVPVYGWEKAQCSFLREMLRPGYANVPFVREGGAIVIARMPPPALLSTTYDLSETMAAIIGEDSFISPEVYMILRRYLGTFHKVPYGAVRQGTGVYPASYYTYEFGAKLPIPPEYPMAVLMAGFNDEVPMLGSV